MPAHRAWALGYLLMLDVHAIYTEAWERFISDDGVFNIRPAHSFGHQLWMAADRLAQDTRRLEDGTSPSHWLSTLLNTEYDPYTNDGNIEAFLQAMLTGEPRND